MPKYVPDPNDSKKQVPGSLSDNAYDKSLSPNTASFFKSPNAVVITQTPTAPIGFYFGSSASFAGRQSADVFVTGSVHYTNFGKPTAGTVLNISPIGYSASLADHNDGIGLTKIALVYKGGLGTGGV